MFYKVALVGVLIFAGGVGLVWWWSKTCFVSVVNDTQFVKIAKSDINKLKVFVQEFVPCNSGYFDVTMSPTDHTKIKAKEIRLHFSDTFVGTRIGLDRNNPEYSFWWERGSRGRLDLTTWVNPNWDLAKADSWERNLVVGLSYLKNDMGENSLTEAREMFDLLPGMDLGVVLQPDK